MKTKFMDRPILSTIVLILIIKLVPVPILNAVKEALGLPRPFVMVAYIIICIAAYLVFLKKYKDQIGDRSLLKNLKKGLIMLLPISICGIIMLILNNVPFNGTYSLPVVLLAILDGIEAGLSEELITRCLPLDNISRKYKDAKSMIKFMLIIATVFGLLHLTNFLMGAAVSATIWQVLYAMAVGVIFGAVYLRTGSVLALIIVHSFFDICAGIVPSANELATTITQESGIFDILAYLIVIVVGCGFGFYYIRASKHEEIVENYLN